MTSNDHGFLLGRRFLPLFVTQFLGAFNDNLFKNALAVLIIFQIAGGGGADAEVMATVAGALFILPYFLFSATAGQVADKFDKARLIRGVKVAEIAIMGLAVAGLVLGHVPFLMAVLFLMGTQSTFFGPLKYGILPQHLTDGELLAGNAWLEAGTFLAILAGTIAGALLIAAESGSMLVAGAVVTVAVAGWLASLKIPAAPAEASGLKINWNLASETAAILRHAAGRRDVFLSILGISWFFLVGATFITQFPAYAKTVLGGNEEVFTLCLTAFSVGIGAGSILCDRLLKGEISARYVPIGALGMAAFSIDLIFSNAALAAPTATAGLAAFLSDPAKLRVLFDLFMIALSGGFYIVPLYAIIQQRSDPAHRARTIAANNVLNAAFMVAGALAAAAMLSQGLTVSHVFLAVAVANVGVAIYICKLLPQELLKSIAAWFFRLLYRVEVRGWDNYREAGDKAVVVVNHVSFLDGPLLAAFLPGRPMFAVDTHIARHWWARPFLSLIEAFTLDATNPFATKALVREVGKNKKLVIFPEGRITVTGALMKVYEGPGMIADKAGARILPVRIDGAQYTHFSRTKGKLPLKLFPKIRITILPPAEIAVPEEARGRQRRRLIGDALYDVMSDMTFETQNQDRQTLFQALLQARATNGGARPLLDDVTRKPLSYDRLVLGALVLGRRLAAMTERGERVGLLLPNANGAAAAFFALQAYGRVPAMLNFTAGPANLVSACRTAQVRKVLTSRRFVERAKLEDAVAAIEAAAEVVYLEDLQARIGILDKLRGLIAKPFARLVHARAKAGSGDPALVLFTSGSEGTPKGVVLSHDNILANCRQLGARVDFNPSDTVFNALPVFHAFGMTGGLLLPLFSGIKVFLYPSPLHYRIVPELVYAENATILFGTDTFLTGYARAANAYDFYSLRYVFAGAEKVRDETRRAWMDKFGLRILEGYGSTECAPVIAANSPMHFKAGTVGRLMPGIRHRLEPVPGIDDGGRLFVSGPNVMLGYLLADRPGVLVPPDGGWYDTGDIVALDDQGFVRILGRAKRFAKIAGEMVSLSAVEGLVQRLWPDHQHAVVSLPDTRKGEQLVLVTDREGADRGELQAHARREGASELMVPRTLLAVERVPVLGTGKTDYATAKTLAERASAAASDAA